MRARLALNLAQMRYAVSELSAACCATAIDVGAAPRVAPGAALAAWARYTAAAGSMPHGAAPRMGAGGAAGAAAAAATRAARALRPLPPRGGPPPAAAPPAAGRGLAAAAAAAAADRDALIDARLAALCREHEALEKQLHGATARAQSGGCAGAWRALKRPFRISARSQPLPRPTLPRADGSVDPSSERYQRLGRRVGALSVVAEGYGRIARLQQEVRPPAGRPLPRQGALRGLRIKVAVAAPAAAPAGRGAPVGSRPPPLAARRPVSPTHPARGRGGTACERAQRGAAGAGAGGARRPAARGAAVAGRGGEPTRRLDRTEAALGATGGSEAEAAPGATGGSKGREHSEGV
jgi:hypothetical protein